MAGDLKYVLDTMKFLDEVIGQQKNIKIDSGIFHHYMESDEDAGLDVTKDIIRINGKKDGGINMQDLIDAFEKCLKQFTTLDKKNLDGCSYCYAGIDYNKKTKAYEIGWDT